tara:strand:- start:5028 stop:5516 length:489 start_codon:yes stop_codon:yes gene_type:complete
MDFRDIDLDENEFDNFNYNFRRKRPRRIKRDMPMPNENKDVEVSEVKINSSLEKQRKNKKNKNRAVLNKLKEQGFFHNRHNHKGIYNQVKKMANEIDDLSKKLIKEKSKPSCKCGGSKSKMKYRNFDGGEVKNIWNKYKTPILIGGAIYFFFFSEMGKKMMK